MSSTADIAKISKTIVLTPLSYLYGAVAYVRNKLFDWNILKSEKFSIPVVSVGNIAVGGTGENASHGVYHLPVAQFTHHRHTKSWIQTENQRICHGFCTLHSKRHRR